VKVDKAAFDDTLEKLLKGAPLPLAEIKGKKKPAEKPKPRKARDR
jgi:hypothetical protein